MSTEDLETLMHRHQELGLDRQRILGEEERTLSALRNLTPARGRLQHQGRGVSPDPDVQGHRPTGFLIGEHVLMNNRMWHVPSNRPTTGSDRAAVVSRVTEDRIYIQTYNGYETWRHPRNLRHLTLREQANIARP